jgi:hypothetical protein
MLQDEQEVENKSNPVKNMLSTIEPFSRPDLGFFLPSALEEPVRYPVRVALVEAQATAKTLPTSTTINASLLCLPLPWSTLVARRIFILKQ